MSWLFDATVATVICGRGSVHQRRVTVARSLRNGDAGDAHARDFAHGHLEQKVQQLESLAVPAGQRAGGIHRVMLAVELDRQVGIRGSSSTISSIVWMGFSCTAGVRGSFST